jgi:hypothetical protein
MSFPGFLRKYSSELTTVAGVLGRVIAALPINRQDRDSITETLAELNAAAESVAKAAKSVPAISLSAAEIRKAIGPEINKLVSQEVQKAVDAAVRKFEKDGANKNASGANSLTT